MATAANIPPGAVPTNASADPFTTTPSHTHPAPLRYSAFDSSDFSSYSTNSPSSARRALEAHLRDTDRRIQDASKLGTTLVQQRRDLAARLQEVESVQSENEVPADLREKLIELEREYNEVGRESARAFLPKSRVVSSDTASEAATMNSVLSVQARDSPAKMSAPSRRQRNQPSNRVHDIEFATEISTSLLAQVRQLQAALAEKDETLRNTAASKATLETETMALVQRIKHMDESEQRYKDESWNLEMRLQELEASLKDTTDKHTRATQMLKSTDSEKAAKERELDDLKLAHERAIEAHTMSKKVQEADLHSLRRDAANHEGERQKLSKKIDELTLQNSELAQAVGYRWNNAGQTSDTDFISAEEGLYTDDGAGNLSDPPSPIKGTPARHGMLESETLKSSLNHAHRMIQNLKNNIHREKTEKIELKRMLQDARDELETRRDSGSVTANTARKRKEAEGPKFKKPARTNRLGTTRNGATEIISDEQDWESEDGERTPSKSKEFVAAPGAAAATAAAAAAAAAYNRYHDGNDTSTDAFETADERNTTESEAFATGAEDFGEDTEGDLTETESGIGRSSTVRNVSGISTRRGDRRSFLSTASMSGDEEDEMLRTPVHNAQQPKYRLRLNRGSKRAGRAIDLASDLPDSNSPSSSQGTPQASRNVQSLEDELGALDDDSNEGTPRSVRNLGEEVFEDTPNSQKTVHTGPITPSKKNTATMESLTPLKTFSREENPEQPESTVSIAEAQDGEAEAGQQAELADQVGDIVSARGHAIHKPTMVDAGVMTEPWEPETVHDQEKSNLRERAENVVGGALAGLGLGNILSRQKSKRDAEQGPEDVQSQKQGVDGDVHHDIRAAADPTPRADEEKIASAAEADSIAKATTAPIEPSKTQPGDLTTSTVANAQAPAAAQDLSLGVSNVVNPATEKPEEPQVVQPAARSNLDIAASHNVPEVVPQPKVVVPMTFSSIMAQEFEPSPLEEDNLAPLLPRRSSKRRDASPVAVKATAVAGGLAALHESGQVEGSRPASTKLTQAADEREAVATDQPIAVAAEQKVLADGVADTPIVASQSKPRDTASDTSTALREPLSEIPPNSSVRKDATSRDSMLPITKPLQIKKLMINEGSQTLLSSEEIESMLRNKNAVAPSVAATALRSAGHSSLAPPEAVTVGFAGAAPATISYFGAAQNVRRPSSAGSVRSVRLGVQQPPLPADHTQKIAAATQQAPTSVSTIGSMGPPLMPASAYKSGRPRTPGERAMERGASRDGTTPRPGRGRENRSSAPPQMASPSDRVSHRTSMSSFASELDDRFNISRGQIMYPHDLEPATDPRMIQAITQTMIGEYLWKYTRKAGRSETSNTRHRRFFWVHPYTRTLYWSEHDPSTAGKTMLKAKSVAIEAVRVITDDNVFPPGLHRKSLIVVTPGREIVFTAPSGQRHETWFNALSYLLLKTEQEKEEADDVINDDGIDDSRSGFGRTIRRSFSKMPGARSLSRHSERRRSLSSYNSRTTRTSSPQRTEAITNVVKRQSIGAASRHQQQQQEAKNTTTALPSLHLQPASAATNTASMSSRRDQRESSSSVTGRISSLASRLRPSSRGRQSVEHGKAHASTAADPAQIYDASIVGESAEDIRAQLEQQERNADMLENVRACCDGKHDVGSLSRTGRASFGNRFGGSGAGGGAGHSHSHPVTDSMRSRT